MEPADAELVARVRVGDSAAFGLLARRYMAAAYAVALARTGEPSDAEDVCQDSFIAALERIETCRRPERFGPWLLSIVRNRAHDLLRDRKRRGFVALEEETAAESGSAERELDRAEGRRELLRAIAVLTPLQREVLLLHDFEGWSHGRLASHLGISEGSARVHLHNGRKRLRAELSSARGEEP